MKLPPNNMKAPSSPTIEQADDLLEDGSQFEGLHSRFLLLVQNECICGNYSLPQKQRRTTHMSELSLEEERKRFDDPLEAWSNWEDLTIDKSAPTTKRAKSWMG
jgi:hypothetical protein